MTDAVTSLWCGESGIEAGTQRSRPRTDKNAEEGSVCSTWPAQGPTHGTLAPHYCTVWWYFLTHVCSSKFVFSSRDLLTGKDWSHSCGLALMTPALKMLKGGHRDVSFQELAGI